MMSSSSQVLDHQLIFHIMYGLRQFYHRQNKAEERRGVIWQKNNSCLTNIERKRCKKSSCCFPNIEDRKGGKNRGEEGSTGEEPRRFRPRVALSHSKGKRNQQLATAISSRITGISRVAFQIQEKTTNN